MREASSLPAYELTSGVIGFIRHVIPQFWRTFVILLATICLIGLGMAESDCMAVGFIFRLSLPI